MKIDIGEFELIHSGVIIQIKDLPIKIKIPDEIEGDFTFIVNFTSDNENTSSHTVQTPIDKYTLKIDLVNCNGLVTGNSDLLKLGTLRNLPLYMNFRTLTLMNVGKTLLYNFYVGKEVQNA